MRLIALPILVPIALLTGACTVKAEPQQMLSETSWRFVTIDGKPAASDMAKLEFHGDTLSANVGCNGMGGPWRIEGQRLVAGPLTQTEMYCQGMVWAQERAVGTLLSAAPRLGLDSDRLTLRSSGHAAELKRISRPQSGS